MTADCVTGTAFASQFVDLPDCTVVAGASITAGGVNGVSCIGAAATTASDGAFAICLPSNSPFSIQMTDGPYPTSYYAEMFNVDAGYIAQLGAISTATLDAFSGFVQGGFAPGKALVVVKVTGTGTCDTPAERTGWVFGLTLPDGGSLPDAGYQLVYLSSAGRPDPTATATSSTAVGIFYNLDPSLDGFLVVTALAPDGGTCPAVNSAEGLTGRVFVAAGTATLDPILLR